MEDRQGQSEEVHKLDLREKAREAGQAASGREEKPRHVNREETFRVRYTDPEGTLHEAALTSRIMTGEERQQMARLCAMLAGGQRFDDLPEMYQAEFQMLAWVSVQIRDMPNWLEYWIKQDRGLLDAVAGQVMEHDQRFFRGDAEAGGGDPSANRVAVDPIPPAPSTDESDRAEPSGSVAG